MVMTMRAEDLTRDWIKRKLSRDKIRKYIQENILPTTTKAVISSSELDHISNLCGHLYLWSTGKIPKLGPFLNAVKENDLMGAVHLADDTNRVHLWIYPAFIYNIAPAGWKTFMMEE